MTEVLRDHTRSGMVFDMSTSGTTTVAVGVSATLHALADSGRGDKRDGKYPTVCGARSFGHSLVEGEPATCAKCIAKTADQPAPIEQAGRVITPTGPRVHLVDAGEQYTACGRNLGVNPAVAGSHLRVTRVVGESTCSKCLKAAQ